MRLAYHLLDVFTDRPLAGNPLAVIPEADGLSPAEMQAIAREFNLSETVFVVTPREKIHAARLRIFTPSQELPFAGHPTVGAACLIALLRAPDMIGRQPLRLVLEEEIGPVECEVSRFRGAVRAHFVAPQLPKIMGALGEPAKIAAALGLAEDRIGFDGHAPVIASAGLPFAFVPVAGLGDLRDLAPKFALFPESFGLERPAVCVYSRETSDPAHHVQARVFVAGLNHLPVSRKRKDDSDSCSHFDVFSGEAGSASPENAVGMNEDPATGSAACAFAAVACAFEQPEDGEHVIVIEQGFEIGRPSLIAVTLHVSGGQLTQAGVGGACVKIGEGFLTL
jgi:trans-2,3-dihydro-3-hydroxyanthranilate isomerase